MALPTKPGPTGMRPLPATRPGTAKPMGPLPTTRPGASKPMGPLSASRPGMKPLPMGPRPGAPPLGSLPPIKPKGALKNPEEAKIAIGIIVFGVILLIIAIVMM